MTGENLLHKLIHLQCTKKVPQFFMVTTCSRSTTRTTDCVLLSWAERNLGRYEHARARHYDSVLHSYYFVDHFAPIFRRFIMKILKNSFPTFRVILNPVWSEASCTDMYTTPSSRCYDHRQKLSHSLHSHLVPVDPPTHSPTGVWIFGGAGYLSTCCTSTQYCDYTTY
jgi:hypothetical protein